MLLLLLLLLPLLNDPVPMIAWPRRARVCVVLVAPEQSSDCGPVSVFRGEIGLGNLLMLVGSSAARRVRSSTTTASTGVRVLLESSVARVLLSVAAAAECSCARDSFATPCSCLSLVLVGLERDCGHVAAQ